MFMMMPVMMVVGMMMVVNIIFINRAANYGFGHIFAEDQRTLPDPHADASPAVAGLAHLQFRAGQNAHCVEPGPLLGTAGQIFNQ